MSPQTRAVWMRRAMAVAAVDLSLIPMFHPFGLSFKFSFFLIAIVGVFGLRDRESRSVLKAFAVLTVIACLGAIWLEAFVGPGPFEETWRWAAIFILSALGFGLGYSAGVINERWLRLLIWSFCAVNLALSLYWRSLPSLIWFYELEGRVAEGLFDIRSPGTMFNPNLSGLMLNVLLLGYLAHLRTLKKAGLARKAPMAMIIVAAFTQLLLASRAETLTTALVCGFILSASARRKPAPDPVPEPAVADGEPRPRPVNVRTVALVMAAAVPLLAVLMFTPVKDIPVVHNTIDRVMQPFNSENTRAFLAERAQYYTEAVWDRFIASPVWGSGFDVRALYPFDQNHFHNDWYSLVTGTGVLGLIVMLYLVFRWPARLEPLMLLPFVLSGFTNAFMPAPFHFILLWILIGAALSERRRLVTKGVAVA